MVAQMILEHADESGAIRMRTCAGMWLHQANTGMNRLIPHKRFGA